MHIHAFRTDNLHGQVIFNGTIAKTVILTHLPSLRTFDLILRNFRVGVHALFVVSFFNLVFFQPFSRYVVVGCLVTFGSGLHTFAGVLYLNCAVTSEGALIITPSGGLGVVLQVR